MHSSATPPAPSGLLPDLLPELLMEDWGLVPYEEALARQVELHAHRVAGRRPDTLVLVRHPPTFTLGRQAPGSDVLLDRAELDRRGIAVVRSDRGGRATYHGPGQVVLYPVVSIAARGLGVKDWVCRLEGALIDTLAAYGVEGRRREGTAGIWTPSGAKVASLGLRVARGVSYHGVALNTGLDASVFDCIVTCGVRGERVTTIEIETGRRPDDAEVGARLCASVRARLDEVAAGRAACDAPSPRTAP